MTSRGQKSRDHVPHYDHAPHKEPASRRRAAKDEPAERDQGIVPDERGQEQPADKERATHNR